MLTFEIPLRQHIMRCGLGPGEVADPAIDVIVLGIVVDEDPKLMKRMLARRS
jgi:hypothetical protein